MPHRYGNSNATWDHTVLPATRGTQPYYGYCWAALNDTHTHTHTHPFNGPLSKTTRLSRYQKSKTNLDFTEARDSVWQWHQLGHMQVCTLLQTDNNANTSPLSFLQARCPSCRPTDSVKALKASWAANSDLEINTSKTKQMVLGHLAN